MTSMTRLAGVALLLVLAAGCDPQVGSPAAAPVPSPAPVVAPPAPVGDVGVVTRVIDGDTFEMGPRTIRVLGIDACEAGTAAGDAATAEAGSLLLSRPVTLTAEPGVGTDRYDRELRYVALPDRSDFGTTMVAAPHTAVYEGENDASAAYVSQLRAADPNQRTCGEPETTTTRPTTTRPDTSRDSDDDVSDRGVPDAPDADAPDPDRSKRGGGGGGRVGRDGDGDGLCNESTVPVPC